MSIITISRGSYSRGAEVAEKVAARLGYTCLARDVVLGASEAYDVPEIKLVRAIESAPSVFERLTHGSARYVAYIRAALLKHFRDDDLVYHGLAGHVFLRGIRHVLKVRVLADLEDRVAIIMERDQITEREARRTLERSDRARRQWGLQLYGIDPEDPSAYDAVVHVGTMGTDGATDMICELVAQDPFRTTPESQAALDDLVLAAAVEAQIVDMQVHGGGLEVVVNDGHVVVRVTQTPRVRAGYSSEFRIHYADDLGRRLGERTRDLEGLKSLDVKLVED